MMLQRHANDVLKFAEKGCAIQITANSLTGHWGEGSRKMCHWLLAQKAVHIIASDAHDPKFRPPVMSQAREVIAKSFSNEMAEACTQGNPAAVVSGQPLPWLPGRSS